MMANDLFSQVWMLPEGQTLHTTFKNLSKLFIHGIYVRFGLLWTKTLLEAAPSLKTFGIKVSLYPLLFVGVLGALSHVWSIVCQNKDEG
jgi:hypothetical protein